MLRFLLKSIGGPGSLGFLAAGGAVCLILMRFPGGRRWGHRLLLALITGYVVLSVPVVAEVTIGLLPEFRAYDAMSVPDIDQLLVLDGDNFHARAITTALVFARKSPSVVWILGGNPLKNEIVAAGVPRERLLWGSSGPSTVSQMVDVRRHLATGRAGHSALIASRLQMPRIAALARAADLQVFLVASPLDAEPPMSGVWRFLPSAPGLRASEDAIYERGAILYYRGQGWMEAPPAWPDE